MIVTCESCGTKFRIDPSRVKKDTVKVRCSKCNYVFTISLRASEEEQKRSEKVIVLDDSFEEDVEKVAGKFTSSPTTSHEDQQEDQVMDEASEDYSREAYKKKEVTSRKSPPLAISKIVAVGVAGLIIAGFFGYKYHKRSFQPASTSQIETVTVKINPQTQAFFIENVQVGQILVVQGEVVNQSSSNVSFILLEGKVIGTNGKLLLSQRFYAGNTMTKEELAQLTIDKIQERMMRREGNSLSNVRVKPNDKVPFMVVFYNLPPIDDMSDYTVEFVSAELEKSSTTQGGVVKSQSQ